MPVYPSDKKDVVIRQGVSGPYVDEGYGNLTAATYTEDTGEDDLEGEESDTDNFGLTVFIVILIAIPVGIVSYILLASFIH